MPMPGFIKKLLCCKCCKDEYEVGSSGEKPSSGWEEEVLNDTVLSQGIIKHAAIVTHPKGQVKAKNFDISKKGIADIISALDGNTGSVKDGITLGGNLPVYIPGKVDANVAIFGTAISDDNEEPATGGCAIFKTKHNILVTAFDNDLEGATNYARKVADGMIEKGY